MKISELKSKLAELFAINIKLPDGNYVPAHFHVTEVGLVNKHFVDCGGTERKETVASLQLWVAGDRQHRLTPQKFLHIIELSQKILGNEELQIEVEYQQSTISKYGLECDGADLVLTTTQTACLAQDACGVPTKKKILLAELTTATACCTPGGGCC